MKRKVLWSEVGRITVIVIGVTGSLASAGYVHGDMANILIAVSAGVAYGGVHVIDKVTGPTCSSCGTLLSDSSAPTTTGRRAQQVPESVTTTILGENPCSQLMSLTGKEAPTMPVSLPVESPQS